MKQQHSRRWPGGRLVCALLMPLLLALLSFPAGAGTGGTGSGGSAGPAAQPAGPDELRFRLANGMPVYLIRDSRFPMVCTRLYVRTGSGHETPGIFGISHVLEHMVFKGTERRPALGQIAREVESLGGYLNAYTSFDKTCYLTDMPSRHWKTGLDIVQDMAFHPLLDPKELEKEKPVIISELEGNEDEPGRRLFEVLQTGALAGTPYGHPIIGTRESIRAVTREALQAYISRWYQPQNMLLVMAGDMDLAEVKAHVEERFGGLKTGAGLSEDEDVRPELPAPGKRSAVTRGRWNKVYLGLALAVPGSRDFVSLDLDLLSYLLAGDGTSLLQRRYRLDRRLVDSISVDNMSLSRQGLFSVTAVLDPDRVEEVLTGLLRDLRGLSMSAFTPEDLGRARFNILDGFDRNAETLNGLTSWRAEMEFGLGGRQGEANIRKALEDADLEAVGRAAARWLRPEGLVLRVLAPEGAKLPDLEALLDREWPVPPGSARGAAAEGGKGRERIRLPNGVEAVLLPDRAVPYVSVNMLSFGGSALIGPEMAGLPSLAASSLTDGCGDMDRAALERRLAEKVLSVGASAGHQTFSVSGTGPSRNCSDLLDILGQILRAPRFDGQEVARELRDMTAARARRDDEPLGRLSARLWPMIFGSHPYGLDSLGTPESLARLDRQAVLDYWNRQKRYPWTVAFAGSFDREEVLAWAAALPKADAVAQDIPEPSWSREKTLTLTMPDRNKAHLALVYRTVPKDHPDEPALMLLEAVLSGQSGLLFRLRDEQSIGYTVAARNVFYQKTGLTYFYAGTTPAQLEEARKGFAAIVQELKEKPLPKELLEAGCNALEGRYIRRLQSLAARGGEAVREAFFNRPENWSRTLLEKTRSVTPADIQRVARAYFHDGTTAVVRP